MKWDGEIDASEALRHATLNVKITTRRLRLKIWIATRLIRAAAWVLGCEIRFELVETPPPFAPFHYSGCPAVCENKPCTCGWAKDHPEHCK